MKRKPVFRVEEQRANGDLVDHVYDSSHNFTPSGVRSTLWLDIYSYPSMSIISFSPDSSLGVPSADDELRTRNCVFIDG